jgi:hypothetical protein
MPCLCLPSQHFYACHAHAPPRHPPLPCAISSPTGHFLDRDVRLYERHLNNLSDPSLLICTPVSTSPPIPFFSPTGLTRPPPPYPAGPGATPVVEIAHRTCGSTGAPLHCCSTTTDLLSLVSPAPSVPRPRSYVAVHSSPSPNHVGPPR